MTYYYAPRPVLLKPIDVLRCEVHGHLGSGVGGESETSTLREREMARQSDRCATLILVVLPISVSMATMLHSVCCVKTHISRQNVP